MTDKTNLIAIYRDNIAQIEANLNYSKRQLIKQQEAIKEYKSAIKRYDEKIKELEND